MGAAWLIVGTLARQVLKLGSSIVLTRVLFPEAFGLVATAGLLTAAVELCSDLGVRQAIVQHREGGTRRYLDSAWTMRVIRGFILAAIVAALAWPFAAFFTQPILFPIVLVISVGPVLRGMTSPAVLLLTRNLELGRLVALEFFSDIIRIAATIAAAFILVSVWGLVIGGLIGEVVRLIGSFLIARYRPRLHWDPRIMAELFRFGRFILLSSLIGYGASRLDSLLVAKLLGMAMAGVYYIAATLSAAFGGVFTELAARVLFPALSRRQEDAIALRERTAEVVRLIAVVVLPVGALVAINADLVLSILYDARYGGAALALRWLCIAACVDLLANTLNSPLMATGRPYFGTVATSARLALIGIAGPVLGARFGLGGYGAAVCVAAGGFFAVLLLGSSWHGYFSVAGLIRALALPGAFGGAILCTHHLLAADAAEWAGRLVLLGIEAALVAALWAWRWEWLRDFLPKKQAAHVS